GDPGRRRAARPRRDGRGAGPPYPDARPSRNQSAAPCHPRSAPPGLGRRPARRARQPETLPATSGPTAGGQARIAGPFHATLRECPRWLSDMLSSEREYLLQAEKRDHPQYLRRSPDDPDRTLFQPSTATGRQQHVESRAVHEPHAREVESEPRTVTAYHLQQLIAQLGGGLDVDLPV